ncbi:MAG: tetratricopeptide repeat protein [Actinomycetaceae bacterium]|nr:tetratricopeptide repeat protein [Actinomycetaceae bacterium]
MNNTHVAPSDDVVSIPTGPTAWEGISWPTTPDEVVLLNREAELRGDTFLAELVEDAAFYLADDAVSPEYAFEWACLLAEVYADLQEIDIAREWLATANNSTSPEGPLLLHRIRLLKASNMVELEDEEGLSEEHYLLLTEEGPGIIAEVEKLWRTIADGQEDENLARLLAERTINLSESTITLPEASVWEETEELRDRMIPLLESTIQILADKGWDGDRSFSNRMRAFLLMHRGYNGDIYGAARGLEELLLPGKQLSRSAIAAVYGTRPVLSRMCNQTDDAISDYEKFIDLQQPYESLLSYPFYLSLLGQCYSDAEQYDKAIATFLKALDLLPPHPRLENIALSIRESLLSAYKEDVDSKYAEVVYPEALEQARAYALLDDEMEQCEALKIAAIAAQRMNNRDAAIELRLRVIQILENSEEECVPDIIEQLRQAILDRLDSEYNGDKQAHEDEIRELYSGGCAVLEEFSPHYYQDGLDYLQAKLDSAWMLAAYQFGDIAKSAETAFRVVNVLRTRREYDNEAKALLHLGFLCHHYPSDIAESYWYPSSAKRLCSLVNRLQDRDIHREYLKLCEQAKTVGAAPLPPPLPLPEAAHRTL